MRRLFDEIILSRLKWGISLRGHIRRQSRLLWGFTVCQKSEIEESIKNERKQEKICLLDEAFNG